MVAKRLMRKTAYDEWIKSATWGRFDAGKKPSFEEKTRFLAHVFNLDYLTITIFRTAEKCSVHNW